MFVEHFRRPAWIRSVAGHRKLVFIGCGPLDWKIRQVPVG